MTTPPHSSTSGGRNLASDDEFNYAIYHAVYDPTGVLDEGNLLVAKWELGSPAERAQIHAMTGEQKILYGLPLESDAHNYPEIAPSLDGHIHAWANMHLDPMRYARTAIPGDITSFEQFAMPSPISSSTYPNSIVTKDGRLFFTCRPVGQSGRGDWYQWEYDHVMSAWKAPYLTFQGLSVPGAAFDPATGPYFDPTPGVVGAPYPDPYTPIDEPTNLSAYPLGPYHWISPEGEERIYWFVVWRTGIIDPRFDPDIHGHDDSNYFPHVVYWNVTANTWHAYDGTLLTLPITPYNAPAARVGPEFDVVNGYTNVGALAVSDTGEIVIRWDSPRRVWRYNPVTDTWSFATHPTSLGGYFFRSILRPIFWRGEEWILGIGQKLPLASNLTYQPYLWKSDGSKIFTLGGQVPTAFWSEQTYNPMALRDRDVIEILVPDGNVPQVYVAGNEWKYRAA